MTGRWPVRSANRPTHRETGAPISRRRQSPPTHCGAPRRNGRDLIIANASSAPDPTLAQRQRQRRRDNFAPQRELLLSAVTKVAKSTGRNCVSALPQRAMPVRCRPRFPSRNRRFSDRCRSADCASTAFRCRCLLLRQKLFVLLRRRLLYPVPNGHTYLCRLAAAKARFDNRHSTSAPTPTLAVVSGSGARGTSDP